jgi:hypothetical protein
MEFFIETPFIRSPVPVLEIENGTNKLLRSAHTNIPARTQTVEAVKSVVNVKIMKHRRYRVYKDFSHLPFEISMLRTA